MDKNEIGKGALKAGLLYTISAFLLKGFSFITTPIFSRMMSKADYGEFNNFSSWVGIVSVVITLNLVSTLISARYDYKETFDEYIFSVEVLGTLSCLAAWGLVHILSDYFVGFFSMEKRYIDALFVYILLFQFVVFFQAKERFLFHYKSSVAVGMSVTITAGVLSIILIKNMDDKLAARIYGFIIPTIVAGIVLIIYFAIKGKRIRIRYWRYAIPISLPYIPHGLSLILLNSMDRTMIKKYCGAESTATYSIAYTTGAIISILMDAVNSSYAPWLAKKLDGKEYNDIKKFSYIYAGAFMFILVGLMLMAPEIMYVLGGTKYKDAIYLIPPIMLGCGYQLFYTMYVNVEQFCKKTVGMAFASVIAAALNYVLNYICIHKFGYEAAAYTTLASYIVLTLLHMFIVQKNGFGRLYSKLMILMCIVSGCVLGGLCIILYHYILLRFCFIGVYFISLIVLLIANKTKIKMYLKRRK